MLKVVFPSSVVCQFGQSIIRNLVDQVVELKAHMPRMWTLANDCISESKY